jgi:hypothetical protein
MCGIVGPEVVARAAMSVSALNIDTGEDKQMNATFGRSEPVRGQFPISATLSTNLIATQYRRPNAL